MNILWFIFFRLVFINPVNHVIKPVEIKFWLIWFTMVWLLGLLWLFASIDVDIVFNFSINIQPVLLVGVDGSKVDVGNIICFTITIVTWVTLVTRRLRSM